MFGLVVNTTKQCIATRASQICPAGLSCDFLLYFVPQFRTLVRIALRWHMGRVFLLYFGNLAILMWALFERINTDSDALNVDPCSKELTTGKR